MTVAGGHPSGRGARSMHEPEVRPPLARLVQEPDAPAARPIAIHQEPQRTAPTPGPLYPLSALDRAAVRADILITIFVLGAFNVASDLAGIPQYLAELYPRGGRFIWVLANGLLSLLVISLLIRHRRQSPADIGLNRAPPLRVFLAALAAVPLCFLAGAVSNISVTLLRGGDFASFARQRTEFFEKVSDIPIRWIFPLALFVGIYEEILFRGFFLSRLRALFRTSAAPILITSTVFGALHFDQGFVGMCQTAVVGLVLAIVAVRARTLWPAILAHAAIDTLSLVFTALFTEDMRRMLDKLASQPAG